MRSPKKKVGQSRTAFRAGKEKDREFTKLFHRFRNAADPDEVTCLGDELGRLIFSGPPKPRLKVR
jgi:hypothetical protein